MGIQGSGKSVLANQLADNSKDSLVFEDHEYISSQKEKMKRIWEVKSQIAVIRHTSRKIFIVTTSPRYLHTEWDVRSDYNITWIFTSMDTFMRHDLLNYGFRPDHLSKLHKGWTRYVKGKRNTRPYLAITRKSKINNTLIYKHHRYKK